MEGEQKIDLKSGLSIWAEKYCVSIRDFSATMDYQYSYGWNLLRGSAPFTEHALGRFALKYGLRAMAELLAYAGYPMDNQFVQTNRE